MIKTNNLDLTDCIAISIPTYTHLSTAQKTWTKIDYMQGYKQALRKLMKWTHSEYFSDHSKMKLDVNNKRYF